MVFKLLDNMEVGGTAPVVILGPNGVGKTRLSVALARHNQAERIAALRFIELNEVPMQTFENASRETKNVLERLFGSYWTLSSELQTLMAEIIDEDRQAAVTFRDLKSEDPKAAAPDKLINTRQRRITTIWNELFPGRSIKLGYNPRVTRRIAGTDATYSTAQMSEGERTALYLISRVVSCSAKLIFVDEPETYFHPLLARRLWNELESIAPDIRFVYITHDIPFALSRRAPKFLIARSETTVEIIEGTRGIPSDVVAEVLGAASFSISATRLVFCEGEEGGPDARLLSAWYSCPETAIIPVGGCNAVRECVSVFRAGHATRNVDALGHIDRDAWPNDYLTADQYVKALPVSEIEGIVCMQPIFLALAAYYGLGAAEGATLYGTFLARARASFNGVVFNKEILNRARGRVEIEQKSLLNRVKPSHDLSLLRGDFIASAPACGWQAYFERVFDEECAVLRAGLTGPVDDFLRLFPAKAYHAHAAQLMNVQPEALLRDVETALRLTDSDAPREGRLTSLRDAVVSTLAPYLWSRVK